MTRVARKASSCAPDSTVAFAVLVNTPTSTATLTVLGALLLVGALSLWAKIFSDSSISALTSMSSLDLSTLLPPTCDSTV